MNNEENSNKHSSRLDSTVQDLAEETGVPLIELAATLTSLAQESQPLFPEMQELPPAEERGKQFKAEKTFGLGAEENKRLRKERKEGLDGINKNIVFFD